MTSHVFDIDDAVKYGVDEAIILSNLRFWLTKNKANKKHIHDGYVWTYNSSSAYSVLFPYWSANKIQKTLKKMEDKGIVISGNYNKMKYDRTKWYSMPEFRITDSAISLNGLSQTGEPIPDVEPNVINKRTKQFSNENRFVIDDIDFLDYEFCYFAMKELKVMKDSGFDNIYLGGLTMDQWDSCKAKLNEVSLTSDDARSVVRNIYEDRNLAKRKSVSLPFILMEFADTEKFSQIVLNKSY